MDTTSTNNKDESVNITLMHNDLETATKVFEQHVRRAVLKVDKYLRKGNNNNNINTDNDNINTDMKLEDFKQSVLLFNSGCKAMIVATRNVSQKLSTYISPNEISVNNNNNNNKEKEKEKSNDNLLLLQETQRLVEEKEKIIIDLQQQLNTKQEEIENIQKESQQQQEEAILNIINETKEETRLLMESEIKEKMENYKSEIESAQTQIYYLNSRILLFEQNRTKEFALLEKMSRDHEKDISLWQGKCSKALQELEKVKNEKEILRGRLIDDVLRVQLREIEKECNRLREENALLRNDSNNNITNNNNNNHHHHINPIIVSLQEEKKQLAEELSKSFEEKLEIENKLFLLFQSINLQDQSRNNMIECNNNNNNPSLSNESNENKKEIHEKNGNNSINIIDDNNNENKDDNDINRNPNIININNNNNNLQTLYKQSHSIATQYNNTTRDDKNENYLIKQEKQQQQEDKYKYKEEEKDKYIKELEERLLEVITTAMNAINEERQVNEHKYQQELQIHENNYQLNLKQINQKCERKAYEAQEVLLRYHELEKEYQSILEVAEKRVLVAEKKYLSLQIDNEQLRVKVKMLERELESLKNIFKKEKNISSESTPRFINNKNNNNNNNENNNKVMITRLEGVISQLNTRMMNLEDEFAQNSEIMERKYNSGMKRIRRLRDIVSLWNNNNNNNNTGPNGESIIEMKQRSEAELISTLEEQRIYQREMKYYVLEIAKKREEIMNALEKASKKRLELIRN